MYNIFSIHTLVYILTHIFLFGMLTYQHLHLLDQCIFAIPGLYTKLWIGLKYNQPGDGDYRKRCTVLHPLLQCQNEILCATLGH